MNITGMLKNARKFNIDNKVVVVGNVYNDSLHRFDDGEKIKTSYITNESPYHIETNSSTYFVEWASDKVFNWDEAETL